MIGDFPGGQIAAMSLLVCSPFAPVLSAVRQLAGNSARSRSRPVTFDSIHRISCFLKRWESAAPSSTEFRSSAIAAGVVVSRGSPSRDSFTDSSVRSRRVTPSPRERQNLVIPGGPPIVSRSRFAAVLSLRVKIASQRAPTFIVLPACGSVSGELNKSGPRGILTTRSRVSCWRSTRCSTAEASRNLNVLHIGNRSVAR